MLSWRRPTAHSTRSRPRAPQLLADMLRSKKSKARKGVKMDSYRKRAPDYTDYAYREAVSKLRYLLAESYTPSIGPTKFSLGPHHHHHPFVKLPDGDEQRENSLVLPSRLSAGCGAPKRPDTGGVQPPAELMSFIERQEEYIEQLEKESQYCREELANLMGKVKEVISENEGLHERRKSSLLRSVFDSFEMDDDEEEETEQEDKSETQRPERSQKRKHLVGPNIVFESRISELEAQLTQTKMDLRKALDEAESLKQKCTDRSVAVSSDYVIGSDAQRQIEALQRENEELNENVNRIHAALAQLREKEASASQKVKRSMDLVDQAQFEKNQAEIEVRRLKAELERVSEKQRESLAEQSRRVAEVERRYTSQTEQLSADLAAQWDNATKLSLELEKQRRVEADLRRELAQKNATIDELKKEFNAKTTCRVRVATVCKGNLQSELLSGSNEREHLSQEVSALKMAVERAERNARQETSRFQAEVSSLRQRLDRADADLLHARKENLRLTEQIASLEKELHFSKLTNEEKETGLGKDSKREKELTSLIMDMDSKHVKNIAELEGLVQSQTQLMEKLKDECHVLTQKLEDSSIRHKEDRSNLKEQNEKLLERLSQVWQNCKELHHLCAGYGVTFPLSLSDNDSDSQMIPWWEWESMNSHSMTNSPPKDDMSLLKLEDLISLSPRSLNL